MKEVYYTIECVPSIRKSWALWRHERSELGNVMEPVAYFRSKELAELTKKELAK